MRLHTGVYGHRERVCTERWLWEKNPLPHRRIEPASAACRSDALTNWATSPFPFCLYVVGQNSPILSKRETYPAHTVGGNSPMTFTLWNFSWHSPGVKIHPWHPLWKCGRIFTRSVRRAEIWLCGNFFKLFISPAYLISCQHAEKRQIDKVVKFYWCSSNIVEVLTF